MVKPWQDWEYDVVRQVVGRTMSRPEAYALLSHRSKHSVDKKIGRAAGGYMAAMTGPSGLCRDDPGYDDTQEWRACVDAGEGSAALLAALARWHPERVAVA